MPSGAKKRKAAKKKKEQTANTISSSTNNNPHGNNDPRNQDERDSDGGDAGSHASQDDHNQQHTFSQGEDEGKRSQSHVTEEKSLEEATKDTESTEKLGLGVDVKIKKGLELKNDLESAHVSIQHVELDKSSSSSSGKSSCSSSDDESQVYEKKSKEEACNIGSEVASYNTENKSATVLAEDVPKVAEHGAFENGDSNSAGDTVAVDNAVKTALSVTEVSETSEKNSVPDVVEPGLKANEEKLLPSSNGISGVELEGVEGKKFPSSDIPTAETSNFAETNQTLEPHEYSEKQPLVASTPPPVQRASFLSCCGLFEAFTGSER
ncbi:P-glycoprotein 9 isoform 1 [Hibiscus syriacus]|uniref:p-glycoprotein 9 isoform 1 n=1 Tax=Hibiscus syriacus TaxID=106335 RepID=A0A6A2ZBW5_HIBSY|nr:uncharacterized protein LOC120147288 [Hibiscus syriacus]KAE8689474.1 P-glycoprotein 9 isoform 1 [Hibiscus syriacus]